jgi:serine/threonine protein phosphatase PrpC
MLTAETRTHPGPRETNEDSVVWDPQLSVMAVADGMGGHKAGEVASRTALDSALDFLRSSESTDLTWAFGINAGLSWTANRLINAIKLANRHIFNAGQTHAEYSGMGTTLVIGMAEGPLLTFGSIGDSRLYTMVDGELRQLTRDDSWVAMISAETGVDLGTLKKHPMHSVLTNVIGARPDVDLTVQSLNLVPGQVLMMCTDGLHGALSDDVIRQTLTEEQALDVAAERLIDEALRCNVRDNVTVLVARYTED